jgi:hypothetical protein
LTQFHIFIIRAILGAGFAVILSRMFYPMPILSMWPDWASFWWGWRTLQSILETVNPDPEMAILSDICVALEILSSEYQHMPAVKFFASLDLEQNRSFLGSTQSLNQNNEPNRIPFHTGAHRS